MIPDKKSINITKYTFQRQKCNDQDNLLHNLSKSTKDSTKATIFKYIINNTLLNNTIEEHGFSDISTSVPRKNREMLGTGWKNKKSFIFPDKITWVSEIQD